MGSFRSKSITWLPLLHFLPNFSETRQNQFWTWSHLPKKISERNIENWRSYTQKLFLRWPNLSVKKKRVLIWYFCSVSINLYNTKTIHTSYISFQLLIKRSQTCNRKGHYESKCRDKQEKHHRQSYTSALTTDSYDASSEPED